MGEEKKHTCSSELPGGGTESIIASSRFSFIHLTEETNISMMSALRDYIIYMLLMKTYCQVDHSTHTWVKDQQ